MSKTEIKDYKDKHSLEERCEKSRQMRKDNPEKFPVILLKSKVSKYNLPAHR